jgi:hypothetical protein
MDGVTSHTHTQTQKNAVFLALLFIVVAPLGRGFGPSLSSPFLREEDALARGLCG